MLLFGILFLSLSSVNNLLAERFELDGNAIGTLTALLPFGILAGVACFWPRGGPPQFARGRKYGQGQDRSSAKNEAE